MQRLAWTIHPPFYLLVILWIKYVILVLRNWHDFFNSCAFDYQKDWKYKLGICLILFRGSRFDIWNCYRSSINFIRYVSSIYCAVNTMRSNYWKLENYFCQCNSVHVWTILCKRCYSHKYRLQLIPFLSIEKFYFYKHFAASLFTLCYIDIISEQYFPGKNDFSPS